MLIHISLAALTTLFAAPSAMTNAVPARPDSHRARAPNARVAQAAPARGKRMRPNHQKRAKIRQRIRALRAWRLTEALNLDERSAMRLFPVLNRYDARLLKLTQQGRKLRVELRRQLKAKTPDNRKLNQLIGRMTKHQRDGFRLRRSRFADLRKVLTPAQSAKLMIVLPEIDRRIHRQIRKAMRKGSKARRRGMRPGAGNRQRGTWNKNPFDRAKPQRRGPGRRGADGRPPAQNRRFKDPFRAPPAPHRSGQGNTHTPLQQPF